MNHEHHPQQHIYPSDLINRDEEHLRLLGIYHLVVAGFMVLTVIVFVLLPLVFGAPYVQALRLPIQDPPERLHAKLLGGLLVGGLMSLVMGLNGWNLKNRKNRISCMILSTIECLNIPIGMILGVSAVLVLRRESVKPLFKSSQSNPTNR